MWKSSRGADSHIVYVAESAVIAADEFQVFEKAGVRNNIYNPGALEAGKTYYWRVDAVNASGAVQRGKVWSFQVEEVSPSSGDLAALQDGVK